MFKKYCSIVIALILPVFLLSACAGLDEQEPVPNAGSNGTAAAVTPVKRDYMGLAWYPNEVLNPVLATSNVNHLLVPLLYEGLFELDEKFKPQPVLCDSFRTADAVNYTFVLKSGVKFHSGEPLTAKDVVSSLDAARRSESSPYYARLREVRSIRATASDTVVITLQSPNAAFPSLLDIPIYRVLDGDFADGTGPYLPASGNGDVWLEPFPGWHGGKTPEFTKINLTPVVRSESVYYSFETGDVSMTSTKRISSAPTSFRGDVELRSIPSAGFHFLGINCNRAPFNNAVVRQALSLLLDRAEICATQLQGYADPALLPINPQPEDTPVKKDAAQALSLLAQAGISDTDGDGALEYAADNGKRQPLHITFLLNEENTFKRSVIERYAASLMEAGVSVSITLLPFEQFETELKKGNFDLYYGECLLTSDFDIRQIVNQGGTLNYGRFSSPELTAALSASRAALENRQAALDSFNAAFRQSMPILPIAFERTQVITRPRLANGIAPRPYNIFYNIAFWTKDKTE